jgi:hypothetical protein
MLDFFRSAEFWGSFAVVMAVMWGAGYCIGTGREFLKGLAVSVIVIAAAGCGFLGFRHGILAGVVAAITGIVIAGLGSESVNREEAVFRAVVADIGADSSSGPDSIKDARLAS